MLTTTESPSTVSIGVWLFGSAATAGGLGWLPLAYPFPYPLPLAWPLPWPFSASMAGVVSLVVSKVRRSSMLGRAFDMARSGGRPAHHASLPGSAGAVSAPRAPRTSINGAQRLAPVSAPRSSAYLSASGWLAGEARSVVRSSRSRLFSQTRLPPPRRPAPLGSTHSRARALNPLRLLSRNAGAAAGGGWVEENAGLRGPPHPPRMGARCCQAGGAPLDPAPLRRRTTQQRHGPAPPMVLRRRRQTWWQRQLLLQLWLWLRLRPWLRGHWFVVEEAPCPVADCLAGGDVSPQFRQYLHNIGAGRPARRI